MRFNTPIPPTPLPSSLPFLSFRPHPVASTALPRKHIYLAPGRPRPRMYVTLISTVMSASYTPSKSSNDSNVVSTRELVLKGWSTAASNSRRIRSLAKQFPVQSSPPLYEKALASLLMLTTLGPCRQRSEEIHTYYGSF